MHNKDFDAHRRLKTFYHPGLWNHARAFKVGVIRRKSDNKIAFLYAYLRLRNSLRTAQLQIRSTAGPKPMTPRRRITDINRRAYAYLIVIVAVILALWGTL